MGQIHNWLDIKGLQYTVSSEKIEEYFQAKVKETGSEDIAGVQTMDYESEMNYVTINDIKVSKPYDIFSAVNLILLKIRELRKINPDMVIDLQHLDMVLFPAVDKTFVNNLKTILSFAISNNIAVDDCERLMNITTSRCDEIREIRSRTTTHSDTVIETAVGYAYRKTYEDTCSAVYNLLTGLDSKVTLGFGSYSKELGDIINTAILGRLKLQCEEGFEPFPVKLVIYGKKYIMDIVTLIENRYDVTIANPYTIDRKSQICTANGIITDRDVNTEIVARINLDESKDVLNSTTIEEAVDKLFSILTARVDKLLVGATPEYSAGTNVFILNEFNEIITDLVNKILDGSKVKKIEAIGNLVARTKRYCDEKFPGVKCVFDLRIPLVKMDEIDYAMKLAYCYDSATVNVACSRGDILKTIDDVMELRIPIVKIYPMTAME